MYNEVIEFIKILYPDKNPVPLHEPVFFGNEKKYMNNCIDSTFVSYVGKYVTQFEEMTAKYTGSKYSVAVVNGTAALQIALQVAGVKPGDEVITQSLTFVATANAISHCGAKPVFVDVDKDTMGMAPEKLDDWLSKNIVFKKVSGFTTMQPCNNATMQRVSAIVPMHTFGFPCKIDEIVEVANKYHIPVIEDSAESLGSYYLSREMANAKNNAAKNDIILRGKHTGTFGLAGVLSYNGNKTITTGGGGMIITGNEEFAKKAKHITTTAKVPHKWEYIHDEVGYNYRMTNVTAAIGVAQMENLDKIIENKRQTAGKYKKFFQSNQSFNHSIIEFISEQAGSISNYWLNCIKLENRESRDKFLEATNSNGVITRPIWRLMNKLDMYKDCQKGNLDNSEWLEDRIVNIPSGYRNQ
ncbi:MAG: LegC family aminotransferase [Melioribacteraceae bacterium]|nr:LegC family aminotransferase [Melioribacteraceae bacterium]MCF8394781.1 LegC family aminotransferase [Melioribacteraceae bacterium]